MAILTPGCANDGAALEEMRQEYPCPAFEFQLEAGAHILDLAGQVSDVNLQNATLANEFAPTDLIGESRLWPYPAMACGSKTANGRFN